ncbi:hypothetical protein Belba_2578 [Belliella baltica DSM 15883]|uniref:Uncharacterized protein n=1 Tax=Belliella baltica (strain DSM 15883 / CIP 108006 / LMG 21964 / BA134) TaxID=866536 RepID=I3Z7A9_BELBD|nr:hypothetical protein Belba_2578 [Belliella baltica DSM 15883]
MYAVTNISNLSTTFFLRLGYLTVETLTFRKVRSFTYSNKKYQINNGHNRIHFFLLVFFEGRSYKR